MLRVEKKDNKVYENITYQNTQIKVLNCINIKYKNCLFRNSCIIFNRCTNPIVENCSFYDSAPKHAIQFDKCTNGKIINNYFQNKLGGSPLEDIINIYKSNGSSSNRISIDNNYLINGGPSKSGGGIILGDNMGNFQTASNNICINPGQYGIAIAGGNDNIIKNNIVYSDKYPWTNVGIYVWGVPQRNSIVNNAFIEENKVYWKNKNGMNNPWWQGSNTSNVTLKNNQFNTTFVIPKKSDNIGYELKSNEK